jgi:hypothetical protein
MCAEAKREKIRKLIKDVNPDLSEKQVEEIITTQYSIANIIFDLWLENKEGVI